MDEIDKLKELCLDLSNDFKVKKKSFVEISIEKEKSKKKLINLLKSVIFQKISEKDVNWLAYIDELKIRFNVVLDTFGVFVTINGHYGALNDESVEAINTIVMDTIRDYYDSRYVTVDWNKKEELV